MYSLFPNVGLEIHTAAHSFVPCLHYCKTSTNPVCSAVLFYLRAAVNGLLLSPRDILNILLALILYGEMLIQKVITKIQIKFFLFFQP